jgi:hypothetical protein
MLLSRETSTVRGAKYLFEDVCVAPTELKSNKPFFFFVNGHHVCNQGVFDESQRGMRMEFER